MGNGNKLVDFPASTVGEWIRFVSSVLVIPLVIWGVSLERRVTAIEANRWTARDQAAHEAAIAEQLALKAHRSEVMTQNEIKIALEDIKRRLERIETRIQNGHGRREKP